MIIGRKKKKEKTANHFPMTAAVGWVTAMLGLYSNSSSAVGGKQKRKGKNEVQGTSIAE